MDDLTRQAIAVAMVAIIYFLPTLTAKGHPHRPSIFTVNLFLGWTLVGWVLALAWALIPVAPYTDRR